MKHKWHDEICAWAGGAEIECFAEENSEAGWQEFDGNWGEIDGWEFRIKPTPKEPQYLYVYQCKSDGKYEFTNSMIYGYPKNYIGKIKLEVDDV